MPVYIKESPEGVYTAAKIATPGEGRSGTQMLSQML